MEEIGINISKEASSIKAVCRSFEFLLELYFNLKNFFLIYYNFQETDQGDVKSFVIASQYEQLENDDLYTKFKVCIHKNFFLLGFLYLIVYF